MAKKIAHSTMAGTVSTIAGTTPSTSPLRLVAIDIAKKHGLNVSKFVATIACESGFDPYAKGDYRKGVPTSFGLAQLHYPEKDWGISVATAYDPLVSMEIMAQAWEDGQAHRWSCYRMV